MDQKNLDIYGSAPIPWSRALTALEAPATKPGEAGGPTTYWLATVRPDGRPHVAGVGAAVGRWQVLLHERSRDPQEPEPGGKSELRHLGGPQRARPRRRGYSPDGDGRTHAPTPGGTLRSAGMAGERE